MMKTIWKLKEKKKERNTNNKNVLLQAIREQEGEKNQKIPGFDSYLQSGFLNDCSFVSPKQCSFISLWLNPNLSG